MDNLVVYRKNKYIFKLVGVKLKKYISFMMYFNVFHNVLHNLCISIMYKPLRKKMIKKRSFVLNIKIPFPRERNIFKHITEILILTDIFLTKGLLILSQKTFNKIQNVYIRTNF